MNIALLGYGKMAKAVETIALKRGHTIGLKLNSGAFNDLKISDLKSIDVAIDFSVADVAPRLITHCFEQQIPVVSGTTGWLDQLTDIENLCLKHKSAFIYASNFSLGVQLFFELNSKLAKLMSNYPEYQAQLKDIHHIHKLDAPSGTAISLAEDVIEQHDGYSDWILGKPTQDHQLAIEAERIGEETGYHHINYQSDFDSIQIRHQAKNRSGFALGAVIAAEWIVGKQGVFSMRNVLFSKEF
ncbi:MAG: 4-hydroxy-tetrahydrodipicolinate reductase [Flavobacteriales bacterium]